jgi:hypothetical protein
MFVFKIWQGLFEKRLDRAVSQKELKNAGFKQAKR